MMLPRDALLTVRSLGARYLVAVMRAAVHSLRVEHDHLFEARRQRNRERRPELPGLPEGLIQMVQDEGIHPKQLVRTLAERDCLLRRLGPHHGADDEVQKYQVGIHRI